MKWQAPTIGGNIYDLSHLDDFDFEFIVPAKDDKPEQVYLINVLFSMHCFTRGIRDGESYHPELLYRDSRETRLFDERRYRLSMQLPDIIREIGTRRCFHTPYGSFFTIEVIEEGENRLHYTIYFKVSRSVKRGGLNLFVESAYPQDKITQPFRPTPIRFGIIAYNVTTGKPIKRQK